MSDHPTPSASTVSSGYTGSSNHRDNDSITSDERDAAESKKPDRAASAQQQLQALDMTPAHDAWQFDISDLLDSHTYIPPLQPGQPSGNNFVKYDAKRSIFVLCAIGNLDVHLRLLCEAVPTLTEVSPTLQALIVTSSVASVTPLIPSLPISLPAIEAGGNPPNHFLNLGLLRPLNDGQHKPLDAIVVIDPDGKRRLVLPFGWGAGRYVDDPQSGKAVRERLMTILEKAIKDLEVEKSKPKVDFYDIARTYF